MNSARNGILVATHPRPRPRPYGVAGRLSENTLSESDGQGPSTEAHSNGHTMVE